MTVQLYQGDYREIMPQLVDTKIDAIIADPPYGCKNDCDYTRFTGGLAPAHNYANVVGDDTPFDPAPWLGYPKVILWGYQFFADKVPAGTVLVWLKKRDSQMGTFLSDCELAWQKGGKGVFLFRHIWSGFDRETERGKSLHPTQKPIALMRWCIERVTKPGATVLDPFMGSGPTGVACVEMGRNFIGIEVEEDYFKIAQKRIAEAEELNHQIRG